MAVDDDLKAYASALSVLRREIRINKSEAARRAGMARQQWLEYETGSVTPGFKNLLVCLEAIDATLGDLHQVYLMLLDGKTPEEIVDDRQKRAVLKELTPDEIRRLLGEDDETPDP